MIAITGVTGFLGGHLAAALLDRGVPVRGVARRAIPAALADRGVTGARADLADPAALAAAFSGCEAVVANAALGSNQGTLEDFLRTNLAGTENTLRAAAEAGVKRVVLVSTTGIYRTAINRPMTEDHPRTDGRDWSRLSTDWRYVVSKRRAEERAWELAAELGIALTALRPGPVYGSGDPKWTARLLRAVARPFVIAPTVGIPAVHARDVGDACAAALETPGSVGRAYNLAGTPVSLAEVHRALVRAGGGRARVIPIPVPVWVGYETAAAARDLAFRSREIGEGMAEVAGAIGA